MTRAERNADYVAAGAPALQDTDPEPPKRLSFQWWLQFILLMLAIVAVAGVLFWGIDAVVKLFS